MYEKVLGAEILTVHTLTFKIQERNSQQKIENWSVSKMNVTASTGSFWPNSKQKERKKEGG